MSSPDPEMVLTGQVPVSPPACPSHKEVAHDREGAPEWRWCNRCGWNHALGKKFGRGSGGWGTPSGRSRKRRR